MLELTDRLKTTKGKKQYGYLQKPLKNLVDEIVDEVEKDPRVAAAYGLWYQLLAEVLRTCRDDMPKRTPLSQQQEFKRIKNLVTEEAVRPKHEAASFSPSDDAEMEGPLPDSPPPENEPPEAGSDEPVFEMPPRIVWSACYKEAWMLLYGNRNTPPDSDKAYKLMPEEVQSGNALAMFDLGRMFADGIGKAIDPGQAQAWHAQALAAFQAVEQTRSNRYAEYRIGKMFASGTGTAQNYEAAAREWFGKSARLGNANAQYQLAKLVLGDTTSTAEEISQTVNWLTKAAEAGLSYAQYALGKLYRDGGPLADTLAVIWFSEAAEQNHEYAMFDLGTLHLEQFPEIMRKQEARAGSAGQGGGRRRADARPGRQR